MIRRGQVEPVALQCVTGRDVPLDSELRHRRRFKCGLLAARRLNRAEDDGACVASRWRLADEQRAGRDLFPGDAADRVRGLCKLGGGTAERERDAFQRGRAFGQQGLIRVAVRRQISRGTGVLVDGDGCGRRLDIEPEATDDGVWRGRVLDRPIRDFQIEVLSRVGGGTGRSVPAEDADRLIVGRQLRDQDWSGRHVGEQGIPGCADWQGGVVRGRFIAHLELHSIDGGAGAVQIELAGMLVVIVSRADALVHVDVDRRRLDRSPIAGDSRVWLGWIGHPFVGNRERGVAAGRFPHHGLSAVDRDGLVLR